MLLFICLGESIVGGWYVSGKEVWVFGGKIDGGFWFPEKYVRCSDI